MNSTLTNAARQWAIRAVLGALILALILSQRSTARDVFAALKAVSPLVLGASVAFYWIGQILSAWKWQQLLRARGVEVPLALCCRLYLAGMFGNLWLPTNIGGDALRATLLNRAAPVSLSDAAASIVVERLTGFAALLFLAALGLLWRGAGGDGISILAGAAGIVAILAALWKLAGRFCASGSGKWARKLSSLRQSLDFYAQKQHRGALWSALGLSLLFQASQVVLNLALARAANLDLPLAVFWWLAPLLSLSGLVPAGIGGFGVREAAALALLRPDFPSLAAGQ
ncbi:MAG: flippase-like domain-containing protein, partial [Armatimonadetes bacterium]|nr:flippase-like domain-containing protein [Armatimonadota bacterium]